MRLTIERRLDQPRWLAVVVPVLSVAAALVVAGIVLLVTGHNPLSSYRKLFDAAFVQTGSIGQTLIAATPLAFTGLAAAAAFRMRLYNIGGEGQLYMGAIFGSGAGLLLGGRGGASPAVIGAMVVAGLRRRCALGVDPGRTACLPRHERDLDLSDAELRRRVRPHVPDLPEPVVLAADEGLQRDGLPDRQAAAV